MPVWHDTTKRLVADGKLVVLGVTQEQHPERCRLFAQWKGFNWPILHDPINVLESSAVPIVVALDEFGIVRATRPNPKTFATDFLAKTFQDAPAVRASPARYGPALPSDFDKLTGTAAGDALTLWGGDKRLNDAIAAYKSAVKADPNDAAAWFRLGVGLRRRSESVTREPDDFRAAVEAWGTALDLNPNQYIWRRRIQQYGPRLDKPYPFYDWVPDAEAAIRKRGEKPIPLRVRPDGAEIAAPARTFPTDTPTAKNPDPDGKITRDTGAAVAEVVTVPARVKAGQSARVHVTFRLKPGGKHHWNNEADPLRVWVDPPAGGAVSARLISADKPTTATSTQVRTVGFEVKVSADATGTVRVPAFALYHVCDDAGGTCRFVRLDLTVELSVTR